MFHAQQLLIGGSRKISIPGAGIGTRDGADQLPPDFYTRTRIQTPAISTATNSLQLTDTAVIVAMAYTGSSSVIPNPFDTVNTATKPYVVVAQNDGRAGLFLDQPITVTSRYIANMSEVIGGAIPPDQLSTKNKAIGVAAILFRGGVFDRNGAIGSGTQSLPTQTLALPSVSVTKSGSLLIAVVSWIDNTQIVGQTPPTCPGMELMVTQLTTLNTGLMRMAVYRQSVNAGASGTRTFTASADSLGVLSGVTYSISPK